MSTAEWYRALTEPRTIAIIGASNDGLKASGRVLRYLVKYGFEGGIFPVNPTRDTVQGLPAFATVESIGCPVDLAVISTPAERVLAALQSCVDLEVPAVIILTSGFAELDEDGARLQAELRDMVKGSRTRVLGPNCVGLVNARVNLAATINTGMEQDRFALRHAGMALVTQSGAVGSFLLNTLQSKRVGLGVMVSTGNAMDITFPEMLNALIDDPHVTGIGGYIEGIDDGPGLIEALQRARAAGKPLGFLKVGRTEEGIDAIASHTGALAGSDATYTEVFRQFGVARLDSFEGLADWIQMIESGRVAAGPRLGVATTSGGMGVMVADYAPEVGLQLAAYDGPWRDRLVEILPDYVAAHNPMDLTGSAGTPEMLRSSLALMESHPGTDIALVVLGNLEESEDEIVRVLREAHDEMTKPLAVVWMGGSGRPVLELSGAGIPAYTDARRALHAMTGTVLRSAGPDVALPGEERVDDGRQKAALEILGQARRDGVTALDEHATKEILRLYGLPVVEERVATGPAEAAAIAAEIGFPVVVKLLAQDLAHKSDVGGVLLNLTSADDVRSGTESMLRTVPAEVAARSSLLVQRMASPGVELLLGLKRDEVFGHIVVVGMGGTFTEVLEDVTMRVPPLSEPQVREMIANLRLSALLGPVRGSKARDVDAVVDAVSGLAALARELGDDVAELDINPLIVAAEGEGACVVDAVIILST